jgi:DNA-binding CsgD family transcriptional regulator
MSTVLAWKRLTTALLYRPRPTERWLLIPLRLPLLRMHNAMPTPGFIEPTPGLPHDLLLERNAELLVLGQRFAALCAGSSPGGCVLLSGEAGVGKTSVLRAAASGADGRIDWLWGTCEPMLSPPPLAPLVDWLDRMPIALAAAVRAGVHSAEVLSGVLSMLRDPSRPAVLVVDDAQWADSATLDLLRYLGRRIESTRALLVLSYRDDALAADHPLLGVLAGLPARSCIRMALAPLSRAGVADMARRAGRNARGIYRATQGNPYFVTELLACDAQAVPASVRDAVWARAAALPAAARELLELVSVSPVPIELDVLEAVVEDARAAAASCASGGLLQRDGELLRFRHELARRAIEAALEPDWTVSLHAAVFDALGVRGAPVERLVHHAARAGLSGAVLALAPEAARDAVQASAHRQAALLYGLALEHAQGVPPRVEANLHVAHAEECMLVNRVDDAMVSRRRSLALHRQLGDRLAEALDLRALARIEWYRGAPLAGQPYAQAAIEVLERIDAPRELAMAYATMAQLHLLGPTATPAFDWGLKALALFEPLHDAEGLTYTLNTVGTAQLRSKDEPIGRARLQRSLELALAHGLEEHAARAYTNLAALCLVYRRNAELEAICAAGLAHCEAHDLDMYRCRLQIRLACGLIRTERWQEADTLLHAASETAAVVGLEKEQAAYVQAFLDLRRGLERAADYWQEMVDGSRALRIDPWYAPQAVARCEAAWLLGDDAQVLRIAGAALRAAAGSGEDWRIGQLACWLHRAGGKAPLLSRSIAVPCALEIKGQCRRAAEAWAALGCRYEQGLALLGGDAAELRDALAIFDALGAAPAARIARRRLRALGVRDVPRGPSHHTRDDPLGLTARERQVLELLALRLSNRNIALRLHRSERTVENHVAALLGKLGVGSRDEAVARAGTPLQN